MKKRMICSIVALLLIAALFSGCGADTVDQNTVTNTPAAANAPATNAANAASATASTTTAAKTSPPVDVDLTTLSSTMVYSEVYNMLTTPEDYVGKTVRMSGNFVLYSNQDQSQFYPAVVIADATACCSQGLEFVLKGEPPLPDGYPEPQTEVTVVGTFGTYDETGSVYCHLVDAVLE